MPSDPTTRESTLPGPAPVAPPRAPAPRPHVNLAAVFGWLACVLAIAAFFLPWIEVPREKREQIRAAASPRIDELQDEDQAREWRVFLAQATDVGHLSGLDLFQYARIARDLNRHLTGATSDYGADRSAVIRRAYVVGMVTLAVLPVLALVLAVHFLVHRFRRAKSPVLILLVLLGGAGGALAIGWDRAGLGFEGSTRVGFDLTLVAAVAQMSAGLFGVTAKNWWRVYAGALVTIGAVSALVWLYVTGGGA
jgi:hypothetical protein